MSRSCKTVETSSWPGRGLALAAVVLACTSSAAWATPEKAAKFYEDALQRYEKGDLPGAVIQLKNTLLEDKKMLAAQLLLGKVLLMSGELKGAEAAFEEAINQGVSRSEVAVPMGQLYLQLGEPKKLLDQITTTGLTPAQQAEVLTLRGSAHLMQGATAQATRSFAEARAQDPRSPAPLVAEAPMLLRMGERDKARALVLKATELAPANPAAWFAQGTILQGLQDVKGALAAHEKALALNPKHVDARVARVTLLMGLNREKEADQELATLKGWGVVEPRASYLRALLAGRRGDTAAATAAYREAVGLIDSITPGVLAGNEPLLMTGALAHRALGNVSKAREYLETLLARNGRHLTAQGMLASIYVETKDYSRALPLLEGLQRVTPDDPHTLFLLGTVQMARKRYAQANELFEKAAARSGSVDAIRELGFSQLSQGQDKSGITNIEKAFAANPGDARAGVQLAMIYMRQGQAAKALQTVSAMLKRDPGNLALINFQGNILGRSGDKRGAREAFQQVLAKDPGFRAAGVNLVWLDVEEKRFDEARARLSQMLKAAKDDPDLLYQMGVLELRADRPDEALRHWQRADEVQRANPSAGLAVVDLLSRQRQTDKALAAAKLLASKYTGHLVVQLALARAYTASGDLSAARQSLQEATKLAEFDAAKQTLIGRMQLEAGNPDGAAYNAQKALQAQADDIGAMALQVEVESARGDMPKAEAAMKALVAKHPNTVTALLLQANHALARGQYAAAIAHYQAVMDKEPSTTVAILQARAQIAAGDGAKAVNSLSAWTRKRPDDRVAVRALAEVQLLTGQNDAARKSYTQLLAAEPNDPSTLSAYATLLQRLGDPAAVSTAEKAVKIAPGAAQYVDTLGWILVQRGDLEGGLRHLRDARLRSPNSGDIRYHLAFALAKSGRKPEAKTELSAALGGAAKLQVTPEVKKLMTELDL